jgi:hypothetical protein
MSLNWISMARLVSPASGGLAQLAHQAGATLAVTLILPWPPHSISATAVGSSPE